MNVIETLRKSIAAGLVGLVLCCAGGCSVGEQFQPMSGTVTVNGQQLEKGVITFFPNGPGTTVGGQILDGRFALQRESGATPGNYRVEIIAFRPSGRTEFDIDEQAEVDIEVQYLPPKYNTKSELTADVTEDGANEFNFELESK